MATAHEYEEATNERVQNVRIGRKRNELQTCETYELRAPRRGSRQIVRANVRGRDQQAGRGKISPTHPRCGIDHWWRASEYLQNRSRRTAGLIRRALELIPTTPILKRTSVDATNEQRLREYLVANIELGCENFLPAKEESFQGRIIKSFDTERT